MRVIQVVLTLEIGGQERLVVRIAKALHERGHDLHVVVLSPGGALRAELDSIPIHDVPKRGGFDPTLYARLYRLFRTLRPDVVHTHNATPLIYAAPSARAAFARSVVHTKHGDFRYPDSTLRLARVATRFVHRFVAVSGETAAAARRSERPRERRLSVIENGIPLGAFHRDPTARVETRTELGIPAGAVVVGSVGRLVSEKDYPLLVRAMAPLLSERVRLVIVGEGDARAELEAQIVAAVDPPRRRFVVLTGARHDVPRLLRAFDLFASSSRTEGLPLAIPEAMASNLPIVATAVGGVPSIVPSGAGVLVPHGDAAILRAAIQEMVDDASARVRMGEVARAYALVRFAEERMLDAYLELYERRLRVLYIDGLRS